MESLEHICKWKVLLESKKEKDKTYNGLGKPYFICLNNCNGYNTNCGGYIKSKDNTT